MIDWGKIGCHWRTERHGGTFKTFFPNDPNVWQMDLSKLVLINEVEFVFTSLDTIFHAWTVFQTFFFFKANRYTYFGDISVVLMVVVVVSTQAVYYIMVEL
jgi:hypothetical protein